MPLGFSFTPSAWDSSRFKTIVQKARNTSTAGQNNADAERTAYKIVDVAINTELSNFIADRLLQLKVFLDMFKDSKWDVSATEREIIMNAMTFFSKPLDLILILS